MAYQRQHRPGSRTLLTNSLCRRGILWAVGLPFSQREDGTIVSGVIDGLTETLSNGLIQSVHSFGSQRLSLKNVGLTQWPGRRCPPTGALLKYLPCLSHRLFISQLSCLMKVFLCPDPAEENFKLASKWVYQTDKRGPDLHQDLSQSKTQYVLMTAIWKC